MINSLSVFNFPSQSFPSVICTAVIAVPLSKIDQTTPELKILQRPFLSFGIKGKFYNGLYKSYKITFYIISSSYLFYFLVTFMFPPPLTVVFLSTLVIGTAAIFGPHGTSF